MDRKARVNIFMRSCNGKGEDEKTTKKNPLEVSAKTQTQLGQEHSLISFLTTQVAQL